MSLEGHRAVAQRIAPLRVRSIDELGALVKARDLLRELEDDLVPRLTLPFDEGQRVVGQAGDEGLRNLQAVLGRSVQL